MSHLANTLPWERKRMKQWHPNQMCHEKSKRRSKRVCCKTKERIQRKSSATVQLAWVIFPSARNERWRETKRNEKKTMTPMQWSIYREYSGTRCRYFVAVVKWRQQLREYKRVTKYFYSLLLAMLLLSSVFSPVKQLPWMFFRIVTRAYRWYSASKSNTRLHRVTQWKTLIKVSEWPLVTWWPLPLLSLFPSLCSSILYFTPSSLHRSRLPEGSQSADDASTGPSFFSPLLSACHSLSLILCALVPARVQCQETKTSKEKTRQTLSTQRKSNLTKEWDEERKSAWEREEVSTRTRNYSIDTLPFFIH